LPENRTLNLSYTSRIRRPPYQSLNPNLIYQDPYTSIQGNPELIPEKIHAVELVGKSGPTTLKLGYSFTQDPLSGGAIRGDDPRSYVLKRLNFSQDVAWYASASHTIQNGWWTSNNTASVSYSKASAFELDYAFVEPKPQPYFFSDNRFRVGQQLHMEVLFWYVGTLYEGTFNRYDSANLTLSAEKSFFNGALKARLIASDIFNTVRASGEYAIGETDIYFDNKWRSSYLRLALTCNFGKLKKGRYNNLATGSSESSRVR
ncbi:MAG: outer membrane beta-barrel protein, partial [Lewinella sp.]